MKNMTTSTITVEVWQGDIYTCVIMMISMTTKKMTMIMMIMTNYGVDTLCSTQH